MQPLGIYLWFGYELEPKQSLRLIRAAGFDAVMLWWGEYNGAPSPRDQVREAHEAGLSVASAHFPDSGCDALWLPGGEGEGFLRRLTCALRECGGCGVDTLVVHLSDGPAPKPFSPEGFDRLRRAADAAREAGVRLALENLRHPHHLAEVLDRFGGTEIGLCYDSGHDFSSPGPLEFPGRFGPRVLTTHLHDNDGRSDQHRLPFDGTGDWRKAIGALYSAGYAGPLCLEVQAGVYEPYLDAEAFLARAYRAASRLRGMLEGGERFPAL